MAYLVRDWFIRLKTFVREKRERVSENLEAPTNEHKELYQPLTTRAWMLWIYVSVLLTCLLLLQFLLVFGSDFKPSQADRQIFLRSLKNANQTDQGSQYNAPVASRIQKCSGIGRDLDRKNCMASLSSSYRENISSLHSHGAANFELVLMDISSSVRSATSAPIKTRSANPSAAWMTSIDVPFMLTSTTTQSSPMETVVYSQFKIFNRSQPTKIEQIGVRDTITTTITTTTTTTTSSQMFFGNPSPNDQSPDPGNLMTIKLSASAPASPLLEKMLTIAKEEKASTMSVDKALLSVDAPAPSTTIAPNASPTSKVDTLTSNTIITSKLPSSKAMVISTSILASLAPDPTTTSPVTVITTLSVVKPGASDDKQSMTIGGGGVSSIGSKPLDKTSTTTIVIVTSESQTSLTVSQPTSNPFITSSSSIRLTMNQNSGQEHSSTGSISVAASDHYSDMSFTIMDSASTATSRAASSLSTQHYSSNISLALSSSVDPSTASMPSSKTTTTSQSSTNDKISTSLRPYSGTLTIHVTGHSSQTPATSSTVSNPASPSASTYSHLTQLNNVGEVTLGQYFQVYFLPKLLAVVMQNVWSASYAAMKMMEPFIQLSSGEGATVQQSLLADFLTGELSWASCMSIFRGQWTILFCNLTSAAMFVLVILVAESFRILPTASCRTELSDNQPCNPVLFANPAIVHAVQALLGLMIVSIMTLIFLKRKQRLVIFSDPSTLASLTTLLGHPTIASTLSAADSRTKYVSLEQQFRNEKFALKNFHGVTGHQQYGLVKLESQDPLSETSDLLTHKQKSRHWSWHRGHAVGSQICLEIAVLVLILALFGIILAYRLVGGPDNAFNNFMAGGSLGPIFILSLAALLAGTGFKSIEGGVRSLEPFRIMAKSPQRGTDSVLTSLGGTAYFGVIDGILHRRWFAALVSVTAVLSDLMGIVVAGVPGEASQIEESYLVCTYSSLAILVIMAFVLAATIWRRVSELRSLPLPPESLLDVIHYLYRSNMLEHDTFAPSDRELRRIFKDRYFILTPNGETNARLGWTVNEVAGTGDQESLCSK